MRVEERTNRQGMFFDAALPGSARAYILTIVVLGLPAFGAGLYHLLLDGNSSLYWLAALAAITSLFPMKVRLGPNGGQSISITVSDVFVVIAILLSGPVGGALVAGIEAGVSNFRAGVKRFYKKIFNVAQLAAVAYVVGRLVYGLHPTLSVASNRDVGLATILGYSIFAGLFYFLLNSLLVAVAIGLATGRVVFVLWKQHFAWASVSNMGNASAAAMVFLHFRPTGFSFPLLATAIVALIYLLELFWFKRRAARQNPERLQS